MFWTVLWEYRSQCVRCDRLLFLFILRTGKSMADDTIRPDKSERALAPRLSPLGHAITSFQSESPHRVMLRIWYALFLRELQTRFGRFRLGYLWALLEPGMHMLMLTLMFYTVRARQIIFDMPVPVFIITGIIPWLLFSHMVNASMTAIEGNRTLFNFRAVKPITALIARMSLEGVIYLTTYVVWLVICWWAGLQFSIADPLLLLASFILLSMVNVGVCLILCVTCTLHPELQRSIKMFIRPLYFISGVFFISTMIPPAYHAFFTWNPVFHAIELGRSAFFGDYETLLGSFEYLLLLAVALMTIGLWMYRFNKTKLYEMKP